MSQTKYAILGMLTQRPMTGYDMKKFSEEATGHFWRESYGNLYPLLRRLEESGLIAGQTEQRTAAPDARVYTLTESGRAEFRDWLARPAALEPVRSELLLKLFFSLESTPEITERHILDYQARHRELRATFASLEAHIRTAASDNPNLPYWLMTLRRGQLVIESRLQWCDECLIILDALRAQAVPIDVEVVPPSS